MDLAEEKEGDIREVDPEVEMREEEEGLLRRFRRYALHGSRWKTKVLTYRVSRYPSRMSSRKVDKVVAEAFSIWSSATSLKFKHQRTGKVHIEMRFERKDHGDEDPFDGKGRAVTSCQSQTSTGPFSVVHSRSEIDIKTL